MAISGGTDNAFQLRIVNGALGNLGQQRIAGGLIESDVDAAIKKLLAGETVFLLARGYNLTEVQAAVKAALAGNSSVR